jgi:hypothetical protein
MGRNCLAGCCAALRRDAAGALENSSRIVPQEAVMSSESRLVDGDVDGGIPMQACYRKLMVVSRPDLLFAQHSQWSGR